MRKIYNFKLQKVWNVLKPSIVFLLFTILLHSSSPLLAQSTDQFSLTLSANGNGTVIKDPDQSTYQSGTEVIITALPDNGQQFIGWSGDATGTTNPLTIPMDADKSVTANFAPIPVQYTLIVNTSGDGSVSKNPDQDNYSDGTTVTLSATPATGQLFTGWSGSASGTANPLTITMDADKSVTATFAPIPAQYTLTVNTSGNGSVSKDPNQATYVNGTSVILTATPEAGQQFIGWTGDVTGTTNPLSVIMDADKSVNAIFMPVQHTLTVNTSGNGSVSKNPDQNNYNDGTSVTLTAVPAPGQQFTGWTGDAAGTTNPLVITMDADKSVNATFIPIQHTLIVNISGNGSVSKDPDQATYTNGTSVILTVTPAAGQQFTGWSGDATGSANPLTVTMDADKSVTATFAPLQHTLIVNISGNGSVSKDPNQATYSYGTSVILTATPAAGQQFTGWSGDATGTANPLTVTMDADKSVTATFASRQHTLIVNISGNGSVSKDPNQATYANGTSVILTATPAAGQQFTGWSGDATGTANPLTFTIDADKSVTATFAPVQHTLTVTVSGNGSVSKDPNQATYANGTSVILTATPAAGQQFTGWSGDATGTANPLTITMDANKSVTATFSATQHTLTVITTGNGSVSKNPEQATYSFGTSVILTATPAAGQQFTGWSGDATGTANPLTITMDANKSVTATFSATQHTLTVITTGNGSVSKNPEQATYSFGTSVILTATPAAGQQFTGWSGDATGTANPLTITMDANKSVTATFSATQHTLTVTTTGNGSVSKNPEQATYANGTSVILTATPAAGQQFTGWSGDATGTANPLTITMDANKSVTATFSATQHTLTVTTTGNGSVSKNPEQATYANGTSVILTATPAAGQQFTGWSGDATGTANPLTITMDANKSVTATFAPIQFTLTVATSGNGTVTKNPNQATYSSGTSVTLTATPAAGQQFTGWSGAAAGTTNPLTITIDADKSVTATFAPIQFTLTVATSGNGTVTKNPNQATYANGTSVTLTATPAAGQQFTGWSGAAAGTTNPLTITIDADKSITATFAPIQFTLTVATSGNGTVTKNPNQATYANGTSVTLTATPAAGQQFTGWSGDATGTTNPLIITINGNKNIVANFTQTSQALITNITATTGRSYTLGSLVAGVPLYTDRTYQATTVPAFLNNAPFIKTANDDKGNTSTSLLSFNLTQSATVYVAYDPRGTALPAWLSGWQKLTSQIGINDPTISYLVLYSKNFPAGKVTLGGSLASPAVGAKNNYIVVALASSQYNLTITASGNGTVTKNPNQATYASGTNVILTATPAAGQQFTGWSGAATGTTNPLTITMDMDKSVTATFAPAQYALTVITSGNGTVSKNPNQATYASGTGVILTATPAAGQQFTGWSGAAAGTTNPLTITMDADKSVTATFAPIQYALTVTTSGNGTVTKNPNQATYASGTSVTLTATPAAGQQFTGWSGGAIGTTNPLTITMDADKSVTATFAPVQYTLTVTTSGNGTVTKNPNQASYASGTSVILTATPAAGQQFTGWSGGATGTTNPLTITMDADKSVTATFAPVQYTLTVTTSGNGTVTKNPNQASYASGTSVILTATPAAGQQFTGWSGDATGTTNPLTITVDANKSVTATFAPVQYTLTVATSGNGTVTKNPNQATYASGTSVTLTPVPGAGQQFTGWSGDASGTTNPLTIIINSNKNITANFTQTSSALITNITSTTGRSYILSSLVTGVAVYSDRAYQATTVPAFLNNAPLIQTPNDDKNSKVTSIFSFDLTKSATVYIAYDPRATALPVWLSSWQKLTSQLGFNDPKISYMAVYSKNFPPGKVTLGGNLASPAAGALDNYFVAAIALPEYNLTVTTSGTGTVIKNPNQAAYLVGTNVTLTATPAAGQQFTGWSGDASGTTNPLTITMDNNKSVTATFGQAPARILTVTISGNGSVSKNPDLANYPNGTSVSLTATPGAGQQFMGWSGAATGAVNPLVITMDANKSLTATFAPGTNKSIYFTQASQTADVDQGNSQTLLDYISTSDNIPVNAQLIAVDEGGNIPTWLSVNGSILNGTNYTTNSEISFDFDATNLSIGTYTAVVNASAAGYNSAVLSILLTIKAASTGVLTNIKVNFQDSLTIPPAGWLRDFGQSFGPRSSAYQDSGYSFGWIKRLDNTPLSLTKNGRNRNSPADVLQATFMHMQGGDVAGFTGTRVEGIWEAQVANGNYDVTVSVGDGTQVDSKHSINIEGVSAISAFIPTTSIRFKSVTVTVSVADGFLTVDAIGGINTKINYVIIKPSTSLRPSVVDVNPENSSQNVSENTSISTSILNLPNGGVNNSTITSATVYLTDAATGATIPANVNGTGGGDAITLVPLAPLNLSTTYNFNITNGVKDLSGASFIPYTSSFTTGSSSTNNIITAKFDKINLPNATGRHSSLTMGPDGKLYALSIDGLIKRFTVNSDGTLGTPDTLYSLQDEYGTRQPRLAIGFAFDPSSTANNLIAWVTHSTFVFLGGPPWDGKLTRLSGNNLQTVQDVLVNLPRSAKDHVTNSIAFGPDGALYFTQGSTSAMGRADQTWNNRNECLLSGAVLRLDLSKLGALPLDVKTADGGGSYNPYAANAPLKIYASGVRNAYDLVWHSNGSLYTPTNGSAAGGNTPASVNGTLRTDGSVYSGPVVPALTNVQQTQKDFLFRVVQGGFYGHPNQLRGEYVMNGGNPSSSIDPAQVNAYPVGTLPDINWRGYAFDFQNNSSPDGAIEYKSNTFNGALKGKLLVVRYSGHDDIITLTPGGTDNDIISATEGVSIPGFSGFIDPLDLTEDVHTGNIYVSEYGGNGKIVLLRVNNTNNSGGQNIDSTNRLADAFVRGNTYANTNYGSDTSLDIKCIPSISDLTRLSYFKFPLNNIGNITYAKLRLYGRNAEDTTTTVNLSAFGVADDSWVENKINFNNAPAAATPSLSSAGVNRQAKYYEFNVTSFVQTQAAGDKIVSFLIKDTTNKNKRLTFNSKENTQNRPQLVIVANNDTIVLGLPAAAMRAAVSQTPAPPATKSANAPLVSLPEADSVLFSMEETYLSDHNFERPKLYPNPFHNKFNIEFPGKYQGDFTIEITDLVGRTYKIGSPRLKVGGSNMEVNISKLFLKAGVYFLRISSDNNKTEVIKLIKD